MAAEKPRQSTTVVEDTIEGAQHLVLGAIEQGQKLLLESYESMLNTVGKFDLPRIPGLAAMYEVRADMFDGIFEFGTAVLENQREFTHKVLEAAAAAQS